MLEVANLVILWSSLCLLLLYKRLPSKVTLLSSVLNVYFIGFQLFSEGKLLFIEGKLYLSTSLISSPALHIETISLVDRTYELFQELDGDIFEAQVNVTEDNEDLNVNPKSERNLHEVQPMSWN